MAHEVAKLLTVKGLITTHIEAMTVESISGAAALAVSCHDGWKVNMKGDPKVWVHWPIGDVDLWAGSATSGVERYFPQVFVESRDENTALLFLQQVKNLWLPNSANYTALSSQGSVTMMLPRRKGPTMTMGGTLEWIIGFQQFELHISDS